MSVANAPHRLRQLVCAQRWVGMSVACRLKAINFVFKPFGFSDTDKINHSKAAISVALNLELIGLYLNIQ